MPNGSESGKRRLTRFATPPGKNSMWQCFRDKGRLRIIYNFLLIWTARYLPSLGLKLLFYRLTGMKVGRNVGVGAMAVFDFFYPELITIEENAVIGYNATILAHEYLVDEYRLGPVVIGANSLIGANSTILAGVRVGRNTLVSAMTLVNRDVPDNVVAGGIPVRVLRHRDSEAPENED